jgi:ectoine hydroxylase-related dioxygenase (phytanoyl-CoA dioxygenase family)
VWTTMLLHGNGHNTSQKPRFAQYISMNPAITDPEAIRQRVDIWRRNTHPAGKAFPGDPRGTEEARTEPAHLTELGRKLLGVDPWE